MESPLKQRLIGAAVLAALAIIFLPMVLKGPAVREPDATEVPLSMPAAPGDAFETRELPLTAPEPNAGADGVLGMRSGPAAPTADEPVTAQDRPDAAPVPATGEVAATLPATPADSTEIRNAPSVAPATASAPEPEPAEGAARVAAGATVLTVGTYANAASASRLAARLRAAGLPVTSERVAIAAGAATRLRVGPFSSRSAAEAARPRVEQLSGTPSRALVLDAPVASETAASAPITKPAPATPAPAAAAPTTALPPARTVASGFAVQLSAPSVEADANALRDRARAAGFAAFVQRAETGAGVRFRVRIGPVADRDEATALLADAKAKLGLTGFIVTSP